jgi:UDP-MurNAc hydroxylase
VKFTLVGHATLYVECEGTTLLVDPWLFGSCYWRSWWHYPPIGDVPDEWLAPDYVFLTHHHFDHFHYPTLRRLSRDTHIVVPKVAVDFMVGEFNTFGFRRITELPHGETMALSPSLDIAAFQYGFDDSALVITDGNTVVANLNDCKIRGRSLGEITKRFGRPTFLLKNYSWAQSYPICYTAEQPSDLELLSREDYLADFLQTVRDAQPTYAIPFASMVCLLHPETRHLNKSLVTPVDVAEAFDRSGITTTQLVRCNPGDSWDSRAGFSISDADYYADRDVRLAQLEADVAPIIEKSLAEEAARELRFDAFQAYFERFLGALPPFANRLIRRPIVFEAGAEAPEYWVLDFPTRSVSRSTTLPADRANLVRIPPGVLADAVDKQIVYFVHISMRIEIELRPNGHKEDLLFWGLLAIWELGYLPAGKVTNARTLSTAWRRRNEAWEAGFSKLFARGPLVNRMTSNLMSDDERATRL